MNIRLATIADAQAIAKVHVDSWRTTYKGIVPDDVLANLSNSQRTEKWHSMLSNPRDKITYVAIEDRSIVGFADAGSERSNDGEYDGELYAIYILKPFQSRGIGQKLTLLSANWLLNKGLSSMLVWVLADNPSCRFYESLGGKVVRERTISIGGKELAELGYGWRDLSTLNRQKG